MTGTSRPGRGLRSVPGTGSPAAPGTAQPDAVRLLFDPDRLRLARTLVRLNKTQLAAHAEVTPAAISQFELGQATPSRETLARLALATGVPASFFQRPPRRGAHDPSAAHFRSLRSTSQAERAQALGVAELAWHVADGLARWVRLPEVDVPEIPLGPDAPATDVEGAAAAVRVELGLGVEPLPHIVRTLESRGALVLRTPDRLSNRVDAFSHRIGPRPLVVLSASKQDAARSRFDAAHELGHLVMHHESIPGSALKERQAHLFASCLLAPPDALRDELPRRADWGALVLLKERYGMSVKSLAFAAHRLGVWSDTTYQRAMRRYNAAGWNHEEPGDIGAAEQPSMLGKAAALLLENGVGLDRLAAACALPQDLVNEILQAGSETAAFHLDL